MPRHFRRRGALLLSGCLIAGLALAAGEPDHHRQLAEQKRRLVAALLDGPAIKAAGARADTAALVAASRRLLEQATTQLQASRADDAIRELDEALQNLAKAGRLQGGDAQADARQYQQRAAAVASFRRAIEDMAASPPTAAAAGRLLSRVEQLAAAAQRSVEAGNGNDGLQRITEAYRLAVGEISRLRQGQEVVWRLAFASPREEFDYEQQRYRSNELLVALLSREDGAGAETRARVAGLLRDAAELKEAAAVKAGASDHAAAVKDMENASLLLNRALQLLGLPVF